MEEAFILVSMDMKQTDYHIHSKSGRQKMADSFLKMYGALASNVINMGYLLASVNSCRLQCLKKGKVDILLLFPLKEVYH